MGRNLFGDFSNRRFEEFRHDRGHCDTCGRRRPCDRCREHDRRDGRFCPSCRSVRFPRWF